MSARRNVGECRSGTVRRTDRARVTASINKRGVVSSSVTAAALGPHNNVAEDTTAELFNEKESITATRQWPVRLCGLGSLKVQNRRPELPFSGDTLFARRPTWAAPWSRANDNRLPRQQQRTDVGNQMSCSARRAGQHLQHDRQRVPWCGEAPQRGVTWSAPVSVDVIFGSARGAGVIDTSAASVRTGDLSRGGRRPEARADDLSSFWQDSASRRAPCRTSTTSRDRRSTDGGKEGATAAGEREQCSAFTGSVEVKTRAGRGDLIDFSQDESRRHVGHRPWARPRARGERRSRPRAGCEACVRLDGNRRKGFLSVTTPA